MRTDPGPRERLLQAARELTYTDGVTVGVDAILRSAGAARRSLYEHFGGKNGLICQVLHEAAIDDEVKYAAVLDAGGTDPKARILALFDWLDGIVSAPGFRGCRFSSADLALTDPGHPAHAESRAHKQRIAEMLARELAALEHPRQEEAVEQLQLLIEGVMVRAVMSPGTHPGLAAKALAERILTP